jgi:3-dehydroquinate dehydratase II
MAPPRSTILPACSKTAPANSGSRSRWLHEAQAEDARAVLLNAAAYTHTSIALLDAIKAIKTPVIEVHLSDPKTRESFRHLSYVGMGAALTVEGHGADSYRIALEAVADGQV